jgi:hypothetical protein
MVSETIVELLATQFTKSHSSLVSWFSYVRALSVTHLPQVEKPSSPIVLHQRVPLYSYLRQVENPSFRTIVYQRVPLLSHLPQVEKPSSPTILHQRVPLLSHLL